MKFGERTLRIQTKGNDVAELQLRLAGFAGTVWDGDFGQNTKKQVVQFQKDFMKMEEPSGIVEQDTYDALDRFANKFPIDFKGKLLCQKKSGRGVCSCQGFGQQRFKKLYKRKSELKWSRSGNEQFHEHGHQFEYPGIHKAVLHTYRAFLFYAPEEKFPAPRITSGYRCHINNTKPDRRGSTNHMGKALDFNFGLNRKKQWVACNEARDLLIEKCNCQLRWNSRNKKSLEAGWIDFEKKAERDSFVSGTWVHVDVRQFDPDKYLLDRFFC